MKPGSSVASPRSMTCAPAGMATLTPTMRLPATTTTALFTTASEVPSKRWAALRAMVLVWAEAVEARRKRARTSFFMERHCKGRRDGAPPAGGTPALRRLRGRRRRLPHRRRHVGRGAGAGRDGHALADWLLLVLLLLDVVDPRL